MTNEETIEIPYSPISMKCTLSEIEALERELKADVLNKIKSEIENLSTYEYMTDGVTCYGKRQLTAEEFKGQVFEIVDKAIKEAADDA